MDGRWEALKLAGRPGFSMCEILAIARLPGPDPKYVIRTPKPSCTPVVSLDPGRLDTV